MRVVVVCTGNVARSPVLGGLLWLTRPDLRVETAAVGVKARSGLRMKKPMRELLLEQGLATKQFTEEFRSLRWEELDDPSEIDLAIGVAPVHIKRLAEIAPSVPRMLTTPVIKDPAYGSRDGYLLALTNIRLAVQWLAREIPR